jgi:hypothetical protein
MWVVISVVYIKRVRLSDPAGVNSEQFKEIPRTVRVYARVTVRCGGGKFSLLALPFLQIQS